MKTSNDPYHELASLFFKMRQRIRSQLPAGKIADPNAWMRSEALSYIGETEKITMQQLATHLRITAPSVTSLIRYFEKKGLAQRVASLDDKRVVYISLTNEGKLKVVSYKKRSAEALSKVLSTLSNEETATLVHILKKVDE
jgi:MarR family 2-MHQ and catechol resistance regulon transcriptional repressor